MPSYPLRWIGSELGHNDYMLALRRNRKSIAAGAAVAAGCALAYIAMTQATYTAQAQLLIDPSIANALRDPQAASSPTLDSQRIESEMAVLRSDEVATAVIKQFKLGEAKSWSIGALLPEWATTDAARSARKRARDRAVSDQFRTNLKIRRVGVSNAIEVAYTTTDPDTASEIANAVTDAYIRFQLDSRADAARSASDWMDKRLAELRSKMNAAERRLQQHRAAHDYSIGERLSGATVVESVPGRAAANAGQGAGPRGGQGEAQQVTIEELESTAGSYRRIYESLLQTAMVAGQQQSFPISNVRVISKATAPVSGNRSAPLILILSSLLGAVIAGLGVILGERREAGRHGFGNGHAASPMNGQRNSAGLADGLW